MQPPSDLDKFNAYILLWRIFRDWNTPKRYLRLTHFLYLLFLMIFSPAQPWLPKDKDEYRPLPLPYIDWMLRRWFGITSYEPGTLAYWAPRLCVVTVFYFGPYLVEYYVCPDEGGLALSIDSKNESKPRQKVPCTERDGGRGVKISGVPFQSEKPPPADPVESGDLITWTDEEQSD